MFRILHIGLCATGKPYNGFQKALIEHCDEYCEINCGVTNLHQQVLQVTETFKPDLVFIQIQTANIISEETLVHLKNTGAKVYNFTGDVRQPLPEWYLEAGKHVDSTLFTNEKDVFEMREAGLKADFLQIGFDPEIYNMNGPAAETEKDIVFMANNYDDLFPLGMLRCDIVYAMKNAFGNRFGIYGSGWPASDGNFMGNQYGEASMYRGAKIAINCSHYDLDRYTSDRMLRALGCGVFVMTKNYPFINKDFKQGYHLNIWETIEELIKKCNYYLDRGAEDAKIIGEIGSKYAHKNFTFKNMVENLLIIYKRDIS